MPVYFDHNATTAAHADVVDAMLPYMRGAYGNPSSVHRHGRAARDAIEAARQQVAGLVGAQPREVIFTSGGTEADNLAIKGAAASRPGARLLVGATEHPAVLESAAALGPELHREIAVDTDGELDWNALETLLVEGPCAAVAVMAANNETGRLQDIARVAALARAHGALLHCDVVQAVGRVDVDMRSYGADSMAISAHKISGPRGVGALILRGGCDLAAQIHGGGQEFGMRSGTENLAGIVGFGVAAELALQDRPERQAHSKALRDALEAQLTRIDGVHVFSQHAERLANTCQFAVDGFDGEGLQMLLDREGFSVSSGSACASGRGEPSHVLIAMGVPETLARGAIRVSFGSGNNATEVADFCATLQRICAKPAAVTN